MQKNIVLIGLSGCGKSTIGKRLSSLLHIPVVDMDTFIEKQEGMTVREIFNEKGEAYFRGLETQAAKSLSESGNKIIATGGGVVLNPENMAYLKQNGIVLFLDRSPEMILKRINLAKRPLLAENQNHLFELDRKRRPLYEKYADLTVKGQTNIGQTVHAVLSALSPYVRVPSHKGQPAGHRHRPTTG